MDAREKYSAIFWRWIDDLPKRRAAGLSAMVHAALSGQQLWLSALGREMSGAVFAKHRIKRVDRWLGHRELQRDVNKVYGRIAQSVVPRQGYVYVIVDWTEVTSAYAALSAAIPFSGRAIPIYQEVHPACDMASRAVQGEFLRKLQRLLGHHIRPIIITDAGFQTPWFRQVMALGWDYVGRLSSNICVKRSARGVFERISALMAEASSVPRRYGQCSITTRRPLHTTLVSIRIKQKGRHHRATTGIGFNSIFHKKYRRRQHEPWVLATSLAQMKAHKVITCYQSRMHIEQTFRDMKNPRFGLSLRQVGCKNAPRLQVLLMIGTLALLTATLLGVRAEEHRLHITLQANTLRNRRVLALSTLGFFVYRHCLLPPLPAAQWKNAMRLIATQIAAIN